jgi:iron complex outermembrane receptor protein
VKGELDTSSIGTWNWEASAGHSQSTVTNTVSNQLNKNVLGDYLGSVTSATFDGNTLENLPGLFGTTSQLAISKLETLDASISTPNLFHLPTGDVGAGFGTQFQHQSEYIGSGSFDYLNPYLQSVDGERNVAAVFYQFDIPLLENLKFSQSGRYDHYSDVGGAFSPRFALRYQPIQALTAYASYDRGFRAPTLIEADQKISAVFQSVTVNGTNYNVPEFMTGNPNLSPERTKNYNVGFELSPTRNTDVGLDWYRISVSNVIGTPNPTSEVAAEIAATGAPPAFITEQFENLGSMRTDGFEATFRQAMPTKLGTFTLAADWAWVWHFDLANGPNTPSVNLAGNNLGIDTVFGASFPRWKGNTSVNWASPSGKWNTTLTWQYTGPYTQAIAGPGSVGSYSQFNLFASYSGFKHWTLYGGINNIFDKKPPYDALWPFVDGSFYDASLYTNLGIFAQIGATYKF